MCACWYKGNMEPQKYFSVHNTCQKESFWDILLWCPSPCLSKTTQGKAREGCAPAGPDLDVTRDSFGKERQGWTESTGLNARRWYKPTESMNSMALTSSVLKAGYASLPARTTIPVSEGSLALYCSWCLATEDGFPRLKQEHQLQARDSFILLGGFCLAHHRI